MLVRRWAAQGLGGRAGRSALDVVRGLLAVQAHDPRAARLAVRARGGGLTVRDVDAALERRELVAAWLMRGTVGSSPRRGSGANVRRVVPRASAGASIVACAVAASAAALAPAARASDRVLSNERTSTRSAHSVRRAPIRARPALHARRIARVHLYTEDGFPEVYLALRSRVDARGREWVKIRIPMRPNGRTGWVRRDALGRFRLTHLLIVVDRSRLRMTLRRNGHAIWRAPVGVGRPGMPTPAGRFWIRERFKISDPSSGYYPYAFGTADYSTLTDWPGGGIVGIHGPYYAPQSIPGRISHGCIRLRVRDDAWLAHHIRVGVPLRVV